MSASRCWRVAVVVGALLARSRDAGAQALPDSFLRSTVLISYQDAPTTMSVGSGFFVFRPVNGVQGQVFLVTNKHVLPPEGAAQSIDIRVSVGTTDKSSIQTIEVPVIGQDGKYLPIVTVHPKPLFDIAVVDLSAAIVKNKIQATWFSLNLFVTADRLKNDHITVGDDILMLGYPDGIFDERNVSPILRIGTIATVPLDGYAFNHDLQAQFGLPDQLDGFLIDANVFPGSSGSVVVLKRQVTLTGPPRQAVVSTDLRVSYVLGILAGSIPIKDAGIGVTERMGLGIVYSANAIRQVIDMAPATAATLVQPPRPARAPN